MDIQNPRVDFIKSTRRFQEYQSVLINTNRCTSSVLNTHVWQLTVEVQQVQVGLKNPHVDFFNPQWILKSTRNCESKNLTVD